MQFLTNLALAALAILPAFGSPVPVSGTIPDSWIVVLNEGISQSAFQSHQSWASNAHSESMRKRGLEARSETFDYTYNTGSLKGYAGTFDKATIEKIAARPEVAYVEANAVMTTQALVCSIPHSHIVFRILANPLNRSPSPPSHHGVLAPSLTAADPEPATSMIAALELVSLPTLSTPVF